MKPPADRARPGARMGCALLVSMTVIACRFDAADRWDPAHGPGPLAGCVPGALRCTDKLEKCVGSSWSVVDDCTGRGLVCARGLLRCASCEPDQRSCSGQKATLCQPDGSSAITVTECDTNKGEACRSGSCLPLCTHAAAVRSNMGCEYWAVDLDNALPDPTLNAAAQQYAVVVSNPQPDVRARLLIEQDDSAPGSPSAVVPIASAEILPLDLRVFKLGPREVDGSPEGEFNTGTGTALTRHAYRITSTVPVVAYQFNPLDNVGVFANDASLLKPVEALKYNSGTLEPHYVIVGWPQTIAVTDNPDTNWGNINLRAFVAIVGTRPDTRVRFTPTTRVIPGGPVSETQPGTAIAQVLQPFEVLNLESGGFNADFTGSLVEADQPVVVFSGSEASDAPHYLSLTQRRCCADHLEEQVDPIRTAGYKFVVPHAPNVSEAVAAAGAEVVALQDPEFTRILAVSADGPTVVKTTLPPPDDVFTLSGRGDFRELVSWHPAEGRASGDYAILTDKPVMVETVQASQQAAGIQLGLPGGDPSLIIIPPMEQYRSSFVFLTPDQYAFDFVALIAPVDAVVLFDGVPLDSLGCESAPADGLTAEQRGSAQPTHRVHRCQLSFPVVDPAGPPYENITPGKQNDGVHRVESDLPVMVIVYGFDNRVSYGYAAGTELETVLPPN